jgi:hypothetical protein
MSRKTRSTAAAQLATTLTEPEATDAVVWLWNRGGKIDRNTTRCGNLMLAINVQAEAGDVAGRGGQNSNRLERVRPGLAKKSAGYWARVMADVERARDYAKRTRSPLSGIAQWLEDGELIVVEGGVDSMTKRDAQEAIEGSADLSLVLEIANAGGPHAQIAREHLERVTGGGSAILGHFSSHDRR